MTGNGEDYWLYEVHPEESGTFEIRKFRVCDGKPPELRSGLPECESVEHARRFIPDSAIRTEIDSAEPTSALARWRHAS